MDATRVIGILSDAARGYITVDDDFKKSCQVAAKAVQLLTLDKAHHLDEQCQWLLLGLTKDKEVS